MLIWLARLVFAMHLPGIPWVGSEPGNVRQKWACLIFVVPLARLPRILMWLACMWWAFDNVAHLPCIWLAFARVVVQSPTKKSVHFLPWLHFFFIIGNGFQRFLGQTFITSISFKYTVCGKKGRKKISLPPVREIAPPDFNSFLRAWAKPDSRAPVPPSHTRCSRLLTLADFVMWLRGLWHRMVTGLPRERWGVVRIRINRLR